jgi:lipopolysaccharide biosynthesis glycosyltransferase
MSKNIVFIPKVKGTDEKRLAEVAYDLSVKSWQQWCSKNNCELIIMEDLVHSYEEMKITWQRYYVLELLEDSNIEYDQVLMIDADTIVHPDCPNFFDMTDHKYTGVRNYGSMDWVLRSIENYGHYFFNGKTIPFEKYINGGFQIVNKKHKEFLKKVVEFYWKQKDNLLEVQNTLYCGTDQTPINFLIEEHGIELKVLPYEFNMQDMMRVEVLGGDMLHTRHGWIYHFNCGVKPHPRAWMEATYNHLYK